MELSSWKERLEREREFKNGFFAAHPQSPIPPSERKQFKELDYYPPNADYRFELVLHEYANKKMLRMTNTHEAEQEYIRWGESRFELHGKRHKLQAYKRDPNEDMLFVPFRDKTGGKKTYGAGRYLDLRPERDKTNEGEWILDFNEAYNPWCAYGEAYTCPLTPPENWLDIPMRAGEKVYK